MIVHPRYRAVLLFALALGWLCAGTQVTFAQTPATGQVLISEFRFNGPGGTTDEFIELYNNTDAALTVADPTPPATGAAGWALATNTGVVFVVPNGTTIPARGHFLAVNKFPGATGYTLDGYPAGNGTTATGDLVYTFPSIYEAGGVALYNTANAANFTTGNRLDAVGFALADPQFREGTGLRTNDLNSSEQSFYRDLSSGLPKDTNDNAADFIHVDTNGALAGLSGRRLGAPGPENLSSPTQRNDTVKTAPLDSCNGPGLCVNSFRSPVPDPVQPGCSTFGTLSIRRRFTNRTGQPVTRLRFRVADITTLGTPNPGGTLADVRALSSTRTTVILSTGMPVTVEGTTLEQPPAQPQCGGYNASLSADAITLQQPLAPNASIDVQFLLGVMKSGSFRFVINVEALNGGGTAAAQTQGAQSGVSTRTAARKQ
jgi:hypothetical protein